MRTEGGYVQSFISFCDDWWLLYQCFLALFLRQSVVVAMIVFVAACALAVVSLALYIYYDSNVFWLAMCFCLTQVLAVIQISEKGWLVD